MGGGGGGGESRDWKGGREGDNKEGGRQGGKKRIIDLFPGKCSGGGCLKVRVI